MKQMAAEVEALFVRWLSFSRRYLSTCDSVTFLKIWLILTSKEVFLLEEMVSTLRVRKHLISFHFLFGPQFHCDHLSMAKLCFKSSSVSIG